MTCQSTYQNASPRVVLRCRICVVFAHLETQSRHTTTTSTFMSRGVLVPHVSTVHVPFKENVVCVVSAGMVGNSPRDLLIASPTTVYKQDHIGSLSLMLLYDEDGFDRSNAMSDITCIAPYLDSIIVVASTDNVMWKLTPTNQRRVFAGDEDVEGMRDGHPIHSQFNCPHSVLVDEPSNKVFVSDTGNNCIRCVYTDSDPKKSIVTTMCTIKKPKGMAWLTKHRNEFVVVSDDEYLYKVVLLSTGAPVVTMIFVLDDNGHPIGKPTSVAVDGDGSIVVVFENSHFVVAVKYNHGLRSYVVRELAGSRTEHGLTDGVCDNARFSTPSFLSVSAVDGSVFVCENEPKYRVVDCGLQANRSIIHNHTAQVRVGNRLELFETGMFADVCICLGNGVVVRAHSAILYESGGFFKCVLAQQCEKHAQADGMLMYVISLQDYNVNERQLLLLLRWVYGRPSPVHDLLRCETAPDTTPLEMFRVANMMLLEGLEQECLLQFARSLNEFNIMQLSDAAHRMPSTVNAPRLEIFAFFQRNPTIQMTGVKRALGC